MQKLHPRWKICIAFGAGIVGTLCISALAPNSLNATVSEEMLNARSEGVIQTQQQEIERLRTMIQKLGQESGIAVSEQELRGSNTCVTHTDCPSIASVCVQNTCQALNNPLCECGHNDSYVICVSDDGKGNEARTVSCGEGVCTDDGAPRCINQ